MTRAINEDVHYQLLRLLAETSPRSQRDMSKALGVSLGAVNYCLRALVEKGEIKVKNFQASDQKLRYAYILTPSGLDAKARLTARFLQRKMSEYEALRLEIERLNGELSGQAGSANARARDRRE